MTRYRRLVPKEQRDLIKVHGLSRPNWFVGSAERPSVVDAGLRAEIDAVKADIDQRAGREEPRSIEAWDRAARQSAERSQARRAAALQRQAAWQRHARLVWAVGVALGLILGLLACVVLVKVAGASDGTRAACKRQDRPVVVNFAPNHRYRHILGHIRRAQRAGEPEILHLARDEADANRDASLSGKFSRSWGQLTQDERDAIDPKHSAKSDTHDRDEYPPAFADEGGRDGPVDSPRGRLADVDWVLASENRSAGAVMGNRLAPYCDGQAFRFERKPGPKS